MKNSTIPLKTSFLSWLLVALAFFASANAGYGQAFTLTWSTAGAPSASNNATGSAIGTAGTGSSSGGMINRNGWPTGGSLNTGFYYEVVVTPSSASFTNTVSRLNLILGRSGTGPASFRVRISNDNFINFQELGAFSITNSTSSGFSGNIDFTANNIASTTNPVRIRIYGFSAGGGTGTLRINANMVVTGTTASATAPEINLQLAGTDYASGASLPSFGSAVQNTITERIITIQNTGTAALTISSIALSGLNAAQFQIVNTPTSVAASSSAACTLRYNRTAVGAHNAVLTINNNDANEGTYTLNLSGNSEAPFAEINIQESSTDYASNSDFSFGAGLQNTTTAKTFTIQNTGNSVLNISSITSSNPSEFTLSSIPTSVAPNATATFTLTFNRTVVSDNLTSVITINNNDDNEGSYIINVNGSSTAAAAPSILVSQAGNEITAGSGTYNFGALVTGTSNFEDFTITNGGGAILNITSITSSNSAEFTVSAVPSSVAQGGGTATFRITYNRVTGGLSSSTITVNTNASPAAYTFSVNGQALIPAANVSIQAATAINTEAATLNATRTDENGPTVTAQGFTIVQGNRPNATLDSAGVSNIAITPISGAFSANANTLIANTLYTVRAYTVVSNGCACTTYSTATTFSTLKLAPSTNATAINITPSGTSAAITLSGITGAPDGILVFVNTVNSFTDPVNGTPPATPSLVYTSGQRLVANIANPGTGTVNVGTITGLNAATDYFVATYTYNNSGTGILYNLVEFTQSFQTSLPADMLGIAVFNTDYTQNFNSMSGNTLPANWRVHASTSSPTWNGATTTVTQTPTSGASSTAGGTYRWLNGTDVAVGAMTSGSFGSPNNFLSQYRNTSGGVIHKLNFSFNLERYRMNSAAASVTVFYSANGSTWTNVGTLNATPAISTTLSTGGSTYFFPPQSSAVTGSYVVPGGLANNANFYFRVELNTTGSNSQGVGIDDWAINAEQALPQLVVERAGTPVTSPNSYDFGADFRDVPSNVTYTIRNTGTLALTINSVVVSDNIEFEASTLPATIAVNASSTLTLTYKRTAISAATTGTVTLNTNGTPAAFVFNLSGAAEDPDAPAITLSSLPVSTFNQTSATFQARRNDRNNPIISRQGFIYIAGTQTDITLSTPGIVLDTLLTIDTGSYFKNIVGLNAATTYTMRPFATVSNAGNRTFYGLARTFTTDKFAPTDAPVFGTITAGSTTASINVNGLTTADGVIVFISDDINFTAPIDTVAPATPEVVYTGSGQQLVAYNTSQGNFNVVVSNLNSGQTYYFQAYALNNTGNKTLYNTTTFDTARATTTIPSDLWVINNLNTNLTQGFNSNALTLPSNWKVISAATNTVTWASAGTNLFIAEASGGSTTGGTRRWGRNNTFTDAAVGVMSSGSTPSQPTSFLSGYINRTGQTAQRIDFSFNLERYRGGNAATFNMYYSTNGNTWVLIPTSAYTSTSAFMGATDNIGVFNFSSGPTLAVTGKFTPAAPIAPNVTFYLRAEMNILGSNGKGVGIDDFTINLKPNAPELLLSIQNQAINDLTTVPEVDFGTLGREVRNTRKFRFVNNGTTDLTINSLELDDTSEFRVQTLTPATIIPGDSLVFNILAKRNTVGTSTAVLTVNSNNFNPDIFSIPLKSIATPTSTVLQLGALANATLNHSANTIAEVVAVLNFSVADDQLDGTIDTLKTQIEAIVFRADEGNTIPNFTSVFEGALLISGTDTAVGNILNNRIEFTNISNLSSNTLGWVGDNAAKDFALKLYFKSNLADSITTNYDNRRLVLAADVADIEVSANSSAFIVGEISSGELQNKIDITGTELNFRAQPQSALVNTVLQRITVDVVDSLNFRDVDINSGTLNLSAANLIGSPISVNIANGVVNFDTLRFGSVGINKLITATLAGFADKISDSFNIVNPANPISYFKFTGADDTLFNNFNNWLVSTDNTNFEPSSISPTNEALSVVIETGKKAVLTSNQSFNNLSIEQGASLLTNGFNLTILNTATDTSLFDLRVLGTLEVVGHSALVMNQNTKVRLSNTGTLRFRLNANSNLFLNTSSAFFTDIDSNSRFEVLNVTGTAGPNLRARFPIVGNLYIQGNHSTGLNFSGNIPTIINGDLEIAAPEDLNSDMRLAGSGTYTGTIAGDLIISRGAFNLSNGADNKVLTIKGNLVLASGARLFSSSANANGNRVFIEGNINAATNATFSASVATNYYIIMSGNSNGNLSIATATTFIPGLEIAKTADAKVQLLSNARVRDIRFVSGNVETDNFELRVDNDILSENSNSKLIGNFTTTRSASQGNTVNFGNMGLSIRALGANPGQFVVRRSNDSSVVVSDPADATNRSARRRFSITDYNNAGSLNATATFTYAEDELNGIPERNITLARSTDGGVTWLKISRSSLTVDTVANSITITEVQAFSEWTFQNDENAPLPVSLTYFTAKRTKLGNELEWQTSAEVQNVGFNIERSLNGKNFEQVGFVAGAGNSNKILQYNFTDVFTQDAYYRLAQLDFDGKVNYSPTIFVGEAKESLSLAVYPNPMQERAMLSIQNAQEQEILQMALYNQSGQLIAKTEGKPLELSVWFEAQSRTLKAGLYMLQVQHSQGQQQLKLIKQ